MIHDVKCVLCINYVWIIICHEDVTMYTEVSENRATPSHPFSSDFPWNKPPSKQPAVPGSAVRACCQIIHQWPDGGYPSQTLDGNNSNNGNSSSNRRKMMMMMRMRMMMMMMIMMMVVVVMMIMIELFQKRGKWWELIVEGSLEVKLPTIWRDEKAVSREKSQKRKDQKKEDAGARKGRKVAKHCVFSWFCGSGGLKSRLAKAAGCGDIWGDERWKVACRCGAKHISKSKCTKHAIAGPLLEVEMSKKCTPLWREAHFEVKMYKTHQVRTTFGSWDVEKVHTVVARSTFRSQNVQNTPGPDHFWKLRCRKSARRCGAKHISKSKCTKRHMFAPLLEVQMSKKCTPLWREAHFEVKMLKTLGVRTTFWGSDVASLRSTTLHYTTLHSTTLHYITLHYTPLHYNYNYTTTSTTLHYTPLHSTTLNYTTLHYTTLHYATLPSTTLHYTPLHYTPLQLHNYTPLHSTTLNYTTLHYTPLHYTTLHYTSLHYTTLHNYTPLHSTTLNYTTLHYITLHYTKLHYTTLHYTTLHSTTLHYTTLHHTTLHYTTLRYLPLHFTTLHYTTLHYTTTTTTQLHNYTPLH